MFRRMAWIPIVLVAAAVYWSVVFRLGHRSFACLTEPDTGDFVFVPEPVAEPAAELTGIPVRLVSPVEVIPGVKAPGSSDEPGHDLIGRTAY